MRNEGNLRWDMSLLFLPCLGGPTRPAASYSAAGLSGSITLGTDATDGFEESHRAVPGGHLPGTIGTPPNCVNPQQQRPNRVLALGATGLFVGAPDEEKSARQRERRSAI